MAVPFLSVLRFFLVIGTVASTIQYDPLHSGKIAHSKDDAYYDFRYAVDDEKSGVVADRWESRSGRFVKGAYSLVDPDGKVRTVHYEVDGDNGFKAVVRTAAPSANLLSIQLEKRARLEHGEPPVNKILSLPPTPPEVTSASGETPFNYHARAPLLSSLSGSSDSLTSILGHTPSSSLTPSSDEASNPDLTAPNSPFDLNEALLSDEVDDLQSIQDLAPPALNAVSSSYDSYPHPVRTNPQRVRSEPLRDSHRTVYSDYVSKELQRIAPLRSSLFSASGRGLVAVPTTANHNDGFRRRRNKTFLTPLSPAPFSRRWGKPREYFTGTSSPSSPSSQSSSYYL